MSQIVLYFAKHPCTLFFHRLDSFYLNLRQCATLLDLLCRLFNRGVAEVHSRVIDVATCTLNAGIVVCMRPANGRRRYIVTSCPIGWAHTQNDHCNWHFTLIGKRFLKSNPSGAETAIFQAKTLSTIVAGALAPCVARTSTAMLLMM